MVWLLQARQNHYLDQVNSRFEFLHWLPLLFASNIRSLSSLSRPFTVSPQPFCNLSFINKLPMLTSDESTMPDSTVRVTFSNKHLCAFSYAAPCTSAEVFSVKIHKNHLPMHLQIPPQIIAFVKFLLYASEQSLGCWYTETTAYHSDKYGLIVSLHRLICLSLILYQDWIDFMIGVCTVLSTVKFLSMPSARGSYGNANY